MKYRIAVLLLITILAIAPGSAKQYAIVADSVTRMPLANASVFDRKGNAIGLSHKNGRLPYISPASYPITIRYLGFQEREIAEACEDTIFLTETVADLPEVVVESTQQKVLHTLAYVREYSTLTTYTDTIFLFREKMADYILNSNPKVHFKGWSNPRVLACKSYYRFTDSLGLDSVSDTSGYHFSWSDWMGIPPSAAMPERLGNSGCASDTLFGKYSPTQIWIRNDSRVTIDVNVLADTLSRVWVPGLKSFFTDDVEFDNIRVRYNYDNIVTDSVNAADLTGYSFTLESRGRGHNMFRFGRKGEPLFVSTYAEVYIIDREYITIKEAKKWEQRKFNTDEIGIIEPAEAPPLQPSVIALVERVEKIDKDGARLDFTPDSRLAGKHFDNSNFKIGNRALSLLKQLTGITHYKSNRNFNKSWNKFRKSQNNHNP